jgi:hypothetical protein
LIKSILEFVLRKTGGRSHHPAYWPGSIKQAFALILLFLENMNKVVYFNSVRWSLCGAG